MLDRIHRVSRLFFYRMATVFFASGTTAIFVLVMVTLVRSYQDYVQLKSSARIWRGEVHAADSRLGYAPIPGARGVLSYPSGKQVPVQYDGMGFRRETAAVPTVTPGSGILFLGDSFTFGDGCRYEETFSHIVTQRSGMPVFNAGRCSYGYAHIVQMAGDLIPTLKPKFVVVQYSPWLVDRSLSPFPPSYFTVLTGPYFYHAPSGELAIAGPPFLSQPSLSRLAKFSRSPAGPVDFLSFLQTAALPTLWRDQIALARFRVGSYLGRIPRPTQDWTLARKTALHEIFRIAKREHVTPVLLLLGGNASDDGLRICSAENVLCADAEKRLWQELANSKDSETYAKTYFHWGGNPPRIIDAHPNPIAHRVIAEALLDTLFAQKKLLKAAKK